MSRSIRKTRCDNCNTEFTEKNPGYPTKRYPYELCGECKADFPELYEDEPARREADRATAETAYLAGYVC